MPATSGPTPSSSVEAGHDVVVVDSFANAKPSVVGRLEALTGRSLDVRSFDLTDVDKTEHLFTQESFDAVIHFAGFKAVGEIVRAAAGVLREQPRSTSRSCARCAATGVAKLVFSSSATVYGADAPVPMSEDLPTSATNPYGWTKVMQEQVLRDVAVADPTWRIALLRYFNPVGSHPSGTIGEDPSDVPNNLMPYLSQVAVGRREKLRIFGGDYPTPDGTGVRDYIHVQDLAAGHIAALHRLGTTTDAVSTWNLGTGHGTSVLELLAAFERACGHDLPYEIVDRRPGDVAASYADPTRAESELGWRATRTVDDMCVDTWRWQVQNPDGYPANGI